MILSLINYKGGVGKTTSTVNIGAGLARRGKSVLLVDTDPQANLTAIAGLRNDPAHTLYDLMHHKCDIAEAIRPATATTLGCAVIPASEELNKIPRELADELGKESILRDWLQSVKAEFDFILLDCCPSRNLLSDNALAAAHEAYIPVQAEHLATQGLGQIAERVQEMRRKRVNTTLHITGIIPTMYKTSQKSCAGVVEGLREAWGDAVFSTIIRDNVALREAPRAEKDVFRYDKNSYGAWDYAALVDEILKREEAKGASNE